MSGPRGLPIVRIGDGSYYFDYRLSQLRNVDDPHDFVDLSEVEREATLHRIAAMRGRVC